MELKELAGLGTLIAALFTMVSVGVALYTYRRTTQRKSLKSVRENITRYRLCFEQLEEMLHKARNVEIGYLVSEEIRQLLPQGASKETTIRFLEDKDNEGYLAQAAYLGISKSLSLKTANELRKELKALSVDREMFPISGCVLNVLTLYPAGVLNFLSTPDHLIEMLQSDDALAELKKLDQTDGVEPLIFREVGIWITSMSNRLFDDMVEKGLGYSEEVAEIVCTLFETSSDRELLALSKKERKQKTVVFPTKSGHFYKPIVDSDDWDSIVECKINMERLHTK